MPSLTTSLSLSLLAAGALAANDWTKPCFTARCSFDVIPSDASRSLAASVNVWADNHTSISDITEAAGWIVLGCNSTDQDLRLVCNGNTDGCGHLSQGGAEGTVVRLPKDCPAPFGLVAAFSNASDQTVPDWAQEKMLANASATPVVRSVKLITDFSKAGNASAPVYFNITGASLTQAPAPAAATITAPARRSRLAYRRSFFGDLGGDIKSAASSVGDAVGDAAGAVKDGVTGAASKVDNAAGAVASAAADTNDFDQTLTHTFDPIVVDKPFNIINTNTPCGPATLGFKADVDGNLNVTPSIGLIIGGTLVPPLVSSFALTAGLSGDIDAGLTLTASASGAPLSTGDISLFTLGLPGLEIPGIVTLGPQFILKASATAALAVTADVSVHMKFQVNNASGTFPPVDGQAAVGGPAFDGDSALTLSVSPGIQTKGTIGVHLTPTIALGVTALGSDANVFIDLDAAANLILELDAGATVPIPTKRDPSFFGDLGGKIASGFDEATSKVADLNPFADKATSTAPAPTVAAQDDAAAPAPPAAPAPAATPAPSSGVQGCLSAQIALAAQVGADAKFFGVFDENTKTTLFSKNFDLFKKCFGTAPPPARRALPASFSSRSLMGYANDVKRSPLLRRELGLIRRDDSLPVCGDAAAPPAAAPSPAVDETVPAASITEAPVATDAPAA